MKLATARTLKKPLAHSAVKQLPVIIEKGVDGFYVVECPLLPGCHSQGKSIDEALRNIREVIELLMEEADVRAILKDYRPTEISFHTISF